MLHSIGQDPYLCVGLGGSRTEPGLDISCNHAAELVRAVSGHHFAQSGFRFSGGHYFVDMRVSLILLGIVLAAAIGSACAPVRGATAAPAGSVVAARPNATLTITQPPAGGSVPAGSVTVTVDYSGPTLVPVASATDLNQYHLHYFLDVDATPYLGTTTPIPAGNPHIVHTAELHVTFDNVAAGTHQLAVVLTGSNHVSVNPPITQQITFTAT
jgi:hypothetical protein